MFCTEYPRPNFLRKEWQNLNGTWDFEFDDSNKGLKEKWYKKGEFSKKINVPFAYQSEMSEINDKKYHDTVWYRRKFRIDSKWHGKNILLNFEAVDYLTKVYVNGEFVGEHQGGHVGFSFDITEYLTWEEEEIVVYVYDPSESQMIPRGKQFWKEDSEGIWYTRTTGIWQTVWLEPVNYQRIDTIYTTPNLDNGFVEFEIEVKNYFISQEIELEILFGYVTTNS